VSSKRPSRLSALSHQAFGRGCLSALTFHISLTSPRPSSLHGCSFRGAALQNATFIKVDMATSRFDATTSFNEVHMQEVDLSGSLMKGVKFESASILYCYMSKAVLESASFKGSDLFNSELTFTRAVGTDFTSSSMQKVAMYGGDFTRARFVGADMYGAMLSDGGIHAKITYADFTGAIGITVDTFASLSLQGQFVAGLSPPPAPPPV